MLNGNYVGKQTHTRGEPFRKFKIINLENCKQAHNINNSERLQKLHILNKPYPTCI